MTHTFLLFYNLPNLVFEINIVPVYISQYKQNKKSKSSSYVCFLQNHVFRNNTN